MAWGYTGGATNGGSGTSASITHGLTINSGDLVVAYINCNNTGAISNDAGGAAWANPINEVPSTETARHAFFWKVAGGSEPATYTWTLPASTQYRVIVKVFTSAADAIEDTAAVSARDLSYVPNLVCEATNGVTVADDSLSVVFGGKDNRNPADAYTTANNSYTGVVGDAAEQSAGGAHRIFTTGQSLPAAVTISGAVDDNDSTYSVHMSFVEGAGGDTNVNTNLESLTITEQTASVAHDINVNSAIESLTITENAATVSLNVDVNTNTESLVITENAASIAHDIDVGANTEALVITEHQAAIDAGGATNINASTESLLITEQQAQVVFDVDVSTNTEALTITENQATVSLVSGDTDVAANVESLSITTNAATVEASGATTLTPQDITNIVDAIFARVIENGETFGEQMKLIRAEAAGKLSVSGNTVTIRDAADTKDRITATVDENGQRTSITTDVS